MRMFGSKVIMTAVLLSACNSPGSSPTGTSQGAAAKPQPAAAAAKQTGGGDAVVAKVGGRSITQAELEQQVRPKLIEIDTQRYEALREALDQMIATELFAQEAKARGITVEALLHQEVDGKIPDPTEEQIQQLYENAKDEIGDRPLESIRPQIVAALRQQDGVARAEAFAGELKKKYPTTVALRPPIVQVSEGGRLARGNAKAPVTIIEFSDYECPYCKRAFPTISEVLKTYGDKVRFVHRDFPLSFHQNARPAAQAAHCAQAQGKFWEYHDKLMASDEDPTTPQLQAAAGEVGLERAKFDECLAKAPYTAEIEKDVADGSNAGVNGTPAFFINGRMLSGAQPFEKFKEVIDEELSRGAQAG